VQYNHTIYNNINSINTTIHTFLLLLKSNSTYLFEFNISINFIFLNITTLYRPIMTNIDINNIKLIDTISI